MTGTETENTTPAEPEEIIDLDVPLAGPGQGEGGSAHSGAPVAGYIAGGAVLLGALVGLFFFLKKKKKDAQKD